jgi:hypothetical protein
MPPRRSNPRCRQQGWTGIHLVLAIATLGLFALAVINLTRI